MWREKERKKEGGKDEEERVRKSVEVGGTGGIKPSVENSSCSFSSATALGFHGPLDLVLRKPVTWSSSYQTSPAWVPASAFCLSFYYTNATNSVLARLN